jgi:Rieske Fe-S protein
MADAAAPKRFTRRTFLGWWLASLMTATVIIGGAPLLLYLWPASPKSQKKGLLTIALDKPIDQLKDGEAVKFDAPTSPNSAFIMADGVGDNAPGDLAFGGFLVKNNGKVSCLAVNCSHLGCPVGLNEEKKSFDCPCHGSRFHLDGQRFAGPAPGPLSHLTWKQGTEPGTIQVDGIVLGF